MSWEGRTVTDRERWGWWNGRTPPGQQAQQSQQIKRHAKKSLASKASTRLLTGARAAVAQKFAAGRDLAE
jgi:hypothetical protein